MKSDSLERGETLTPNSWTRGHFLKYMPQHWGIWTQDSNSASLKQRLQSRVYTWGLGLGDIWIMPGNWLENDDIQLIEKSSSSDINNYAVIRLVAPE